MLKCKAHDVPESFESWSLAIGCTHLTRESFGYDNLDATIAFASVPMALLEDLRVEGREV